MLIVGALMQAAPRAWNGARQQSAAHVCGVSPSSRDGGALEKPRGRERIRKHDRRFGARLLQARGIGAEGLAIPHAAAPLQCDQVVDQRDEAKQVGHRAARGDDQPDGRKAASDVGDCGKRHDGVAEPVRRHHQDGRRIRHQPRHQTRHPAPTRRPACRHRASDDASTSTGRGAGARTSRGRRCSAA